MAYMARAHRPMRECAALPGCHQLPNVEIADVSQLYGNVKNTLNVKCKIITI